VCVRPSLPLETGAIKRSHQTRSKIFTPRIVAITVKVSSKTHSQNAVIHTNTAAKHVLHQTKSDTIAIHPPINKIIQHSHQTKRSKRVVNTTHYQVQYKQTQQTSILSAGFEFAATFPFRDFVERNWRFSAFGFSEENFEESIEFKFSKFALIKSTKSAKFLEEVEKEVEVNKMRQNVKTASRARFKVEIRYLRSLLKNTSLLQPTQLHSHTYTAGPTTQLSFKKHSFCCALWAQPTLMY
jgi:hypothetical protein